MSVFQRLMGLETEYAIRFRTIGPETERPSDEVLYERLITHLQQSLPVAKSDSWKPGYFLATGGVVQLERPWYARQSGLLEGATPECRSPRDLLIWQRAQDKLISEAAVAAGLPEGEFTLLKNNRDPKDRTYGSHENFEAVFTSNRFWRLLWRVGVMVSFPFVFATWLFLVVLLLVLFFAFLIIAWGAWMVTAVSAAMRNVAPPPFGKYVDTFLFGDGRDTSVGGLGWSLPVVGIGFFVPTMLGLSLLIRLLAFPQHRRALVPFLVTRTIFTGTGWVDAQGRYHISQKAERVNCVDGWVMFGEQPMFKLSHLLETALGVPFWPSRIRRLFEDRQRMQICLGDSNMCEEAEYLRLATTALVMDVIEGGGLPNRPRIWFPIRALRRISRDLDLQEKVATWEGRKLTGLEVQRFYLGACQEFVAKLDECPEEVHDVLERWEQVLDGLEQDRRSLVGRVDWITKEFLVENAGVDLPFEAKKKIDLRYHELTADGYFTQLSQTGLIRRLTTDEEVEKAMRNAPTATPASVRAHYIREFGNSDVPLRVHWQSIRIGEGKDRRVIELR